LRFVLRDYLVGGGQFFQSGHHLRLGRFCVSGWPDGIGSRENGSHGPELGGSGLVNWPNTPTSSGVVV
jgi:hypothetical protein